MSIQQAMNNMLMSAQFGAGLWSNSPAGQKYFQQKQEEKTDVSIQQAKKELQLQYAEELDNEQATPLEKEKIKRVLEREKSLRQTQFERDPAAYAEAYDWSLFDLDLLEKGNMKALGFERTALKKLKEKTDTKTEQKNAFKNRFNSLKEGMKMAETRRTNQDKMRDIALPGNEEQKAAFQNRLNSLKKGIKTAETRATNQNKKREKALPGGKE